MYKSVNTDFRSEEERVILVSKSCRLSMQSDLWILNFIYCEILNPQYYLSFEVKSLVNLQVHAIFGFMLYIVKSCEILLFVFSGSPLFLICVQADLSGFRSQGERDHCCLYLFFRNKLVLFASFITLYILTDNCWNSPVTCLSSELSFQSQTCCRWFALSVHYKSSIFV